MFFLNWGKQSWSKGGNISISCINCSSFIICPQYSVQSTVKSLLELPSSHTEHKDIAVHSNPSFSLKNGNLPLLLWINGIWNMSTLWILWWPCCEKKTTRTNVTKLRRKRGGLCGAEVAESSCCWFSELSSVFPCFAEKRTSAEDKLHFVRGLSEKR